jgi:hypothetical protein
MYNRASPETAAMMDWNIRALRFCECHPLDAGLELFGKERSEEAVGLVGREED